MSYLQVIQLIRKAQELASKLGVNNVLQPGIVKELLIAETLGHKLLSSKRNADACDKENENILYEYLTCIEGGCSQIDRMFKEPEDKRSQSLLRITRNSKIYLVVFFKNQPIKIKDIYELDPKIVCDYACDQLNSSINAISHFSMSVTWAQENEKKIEFETK